jgi:hypothetical protein
MLELANKVAHAVRDEIGKSLSVLQERLVYGPGPFSYSDYMAFNGGKSVLHAQTLDGFYPGRWGLNVKPKATGRAVWPFAVEEGSVFWSATLTGVSFSYTDEGITKQEPNDAQTFDSNINGISVRSSAGGESFVTVSQRRKLRKVEFDITEHIAGAE